MKNLNNIILAYDNDNNPVIINLDDICYVLNGTCYTHDSETDIEIIHNVEKFQEMMKKSNCEAPFIYLHDPDNNPMLVNIDNIQHVFVGNIVFTNNTDIDVTESVSNIYKKIKEYKSNNIIKYDNIINTKVKPDSTGVISKNKSNFPSGNKNISDIDNQMVPKLVKLYLTCNRNLNFTM